MTKSILYVGVDVDDKFFHVSGLCLETGEIIEFKIKPTLGALVNRLEKLQEKEFNLKVCYEATYIGYNLCRDLISHDIDCEIIAPSLIPGQPGKRVKTDKLDSRKLAEYYAKGLLTPIYIPDEKDEQVRSLIRSRKFLINQQKNLKLYITSICRINNLNYKEETGLKNYWTKKHIDWLSIKINKMEECIKLTFEVLVNQYDKYDESISELESKIKEISKTTKYKKKVEAINCFRGLDTLSSMTLVTELGDIKRFIHPKKITSYSGLDIIEYSSGGKEKKYGITKMGNKRIRTTAIEACQSVRTGNKLSRRLREARKKVKNIKIIEIADRCRDRLKIKANRMYYAGKPNNKIKVACARELLNFVWEMLTYVS